MVTALIRYLAIMKRFFLFIVASAVAATSCVWASDGQSIPMIVTKSGKTYQNCRIFKQYPDGVMFSHQNGAAKILYADMTDTMRNALGYDAGKEEAYQKALVEKRQKEREREFELGKLLIQARIAEAELEGKRIEFGQVQGGYNDAVWNSGTLDYTTVWPWSYLGGNLGAYGLRNGQRGHDYGYRGNRGVFQNGPICNSTNGNSISVSRRGAGQASCNTAKPSLGVPALGGFAPPMAVRDIPAPRR